MSEEKALESLGLEDEVLDEPETEQPEPETEEETTPSYTKEQWEADQETKAVAAGWTPFEKWVEAGHDPKEWRDAAAFNTFGAMASQIKQQKEYFDKRLDNVNQLYRVQIDRLNKERDEAIDMGDKAAVKNLDKQINSLQNSEAQSGPQAQGQELLSQWNQANPWINDVSPKSSFARDIFAQAVAVEKKSVPEAIATVERAIAQQFPAQKQSVKRVPPAESGGGAKPSGGNKNSTITMADLTPEETIGWKAGLWSTEKEFLKAVQDSRKAEARK